MKYLTLLITFVFISCNTTRVSIVDGYVYKTEKIVRLTNKPDTIEYMTLWNGDTISVKEFDRRWDNAINKTTKKLKKELNN